MICAFKTSHLVVQLTHTLLQQVQHQGHRHLLVDAQNVCHHQVLISRDRHGYIQIIFARYPEKAVYMRKKAKNTVEELVTISTRNV